MWPWSEIRLLKSSLRQFAGDHVLAKVLAERESALEMGGEVRDLTLMFLDVAGITAAAGLDVSQLCDFMSEYLEIVTANVFAHNGTLDSYSGDAVFAWWDCGDNHTNATNACQCAMKIVRRIAAQNVVWSERKFPNLQLKVGINSGAVLIGNYGTSRRTRFTALGDQVNLASLLCDLAGSQYSVPILISGNTQALLPKESGASLLDTISVKGNASPVRLYAI